MDIHEHLRHLEHASELLADAADRAGGRAPVPTCPDWRIDTLVGHTGAVHRWATGYLTERLSSPVPMADPPELTGTALTDWFREGSRRLLDVLASAPDDLECWAFLPAPTPRAFWARRQAHETTVHRVDAESALGGGLSPVAPRLAADGIDELLTGFHAREVSRVRSEVPRTVRLRAEFPSGSAQPHDPSPGVRPEDEPGTWTVYLSDAPPRTVRSPEAHPPQAPVDCEISGPVDQLYLALWNRLPLEDLKVTGDTSVVRLWRERSAVVSRNSRARREG